PRGGARTRACPPSVRARPGRRPRRARRGHGGGRAARMGQRRHAAPVPAGGVALLEAPLRRAPRTPGGGEPRPLGPAPRAAPRRRGARGPARDGACHSPALPGARRRTPRRRGRDPGDRGRPPPRGSGRVSTAGGPWTGLDVASGALWALAYLLIV